MSMSQFIYDESKQLESVSDFPRVQCKVSLAIESSNQPGLKIDLYLMVIMIQVYVVGSFRVFVQSCLCWGTNFFQVT